MSKHSSIHQSKQKDEALNINHSAKPSNLGSAKKSLLNNDNPQKEWVATYIDGQYFLADPDAMNKLKIIQAQLMEEKNKLAILQHQNVDANNSFLSLQQQKAQRMSNKSQCHTEFIQNKHISNQQKVKQELEHQEEKYRQKIKKMQNERIQLKKNMKLAQQKEKTKKNNSNEIQKSQKQSVKPSSNKQKSYHKSKLQKSIHENNNVEQNILSSNLQAEQKSVNHKTPSQKPISVIKSIKPIINNQQSNNKIEASQKKQQSIKVQKSINNQNESGDIAKVEAYEVHVIQVASQSSQKKVTTQRKSSKAKQQSIINNQQMDQIQKSHKSDLKSNKIIQADNFQHLEVKSRQSKLPQEDKKSKKTNKSIANQDIKSNKSKINQLIELDEHKSKKSYAGSNKPSQLQNKQEIKSKSSQLQINNNDAKSQRKSVKPYLILNKQEQVLSKHQKMLQIQKSQSKNNVKSKKSSKNQEENIDDKQSHKISNNEEIKSQKSNNNEEKSHKASNYQKSHKSNLHQQEVKSHKNNQYQQSPKNIIQKSIHDKSINNNLNSNEEQHNIQNNSIKKSIINNSNNNIGQHKSQKNSIKQKLQSSIHQSKYKQQIKSHKSNNYQQNEKQKSKTSYKISKKEESFKESSIKQKSISNYKSQKGQQLIESNVQPNNLEQIDHRLATTKPNKLQNSVKSKNVSQYEKQIQKSIQRSSKSRHSNLKDSKLNIQKQEVDKKDQSIQYSRLSQHKQSNNHINSIKFKQQSQSNNYFINNDSSILKQSSHYEKQQITQRLPPHQIEKQPEINMKKNKKNSFIEDNYEKMSNNDNKSQKKSRAFIIHSRHGSVKQKTEKNYEKLNNSKYSSRKSRNSQFEHHYADDASVTKNEIAKLNQQILLLQQKLQKVQEKQEQMQKYESIISKTPKQQSIHEHQAQPQEIYIPEYNIPQVKLISKAPVRLQIESSIINVNTNQDMRKKQEKQQQINEKNRLKLQIDRLRKIIVDMQIQKIKSIDHENQLLGDSGLKKLNSKVVADNDGRQSRQFQKQSLNSLDSPLTQRRFYGSGAKQKGEQFGKIIKNNISYLQAVDKKVQTPRKRSNFKLPYHVNEQQVVTEQFLNDSNKRATFKNKFYSQARRNDLIDRLNNSSKDSHHFMESNKIIAQDGYKGQSSQVNQYNTNNNTFHNFSKIAVQNNQNPNNPFNKVNFSRMVQYMKKTNPQQQEILPEIHLRDIKVPNLPNCPHADMTQEQLLQLAKFTYQAFGVNIDEEDRQLCVKKYKNCVIFTINNQSHQCILWHFSGKFYMGGWKSGQPGQGQKNGEGIEIIPDKHIYRGQFLNGKKNGTGILKLINGNLYDGQWIQGVKNGRGVYLDAATKVIYSGEWKDGKKDGQGYLKLSDKQYYYGTFVKSVKQGYGVQVFVNGDKYKGQYKNGKFHGKGKYIWANESCYQGQFTQGVRFGQGSWKSAKNNADIYIGTYLNDKKNGYGRYVWANGCIYEGGFVNDVKHGKGRLTYQDGKQIKGVWQQGNLISTDTQKKVVDNEEQPLRRSLKVSNFGYHNSGQKNI